MTPAGAAAAEACEGVRRLDKDSPGEGGLGVYLEDLWTKEVGLEVR